MHILELPFPPISGSAYTRHARRGSFITKYKVPKAIAYIKDIREAAERAGKADLMLPGPLDIEIEITPPDLRARDADNVMNLFLDAVTSAGVWVDDSNRVIGKTTISWRPKVKGGSITLTLKPHISPITEPRVSKINRKDIVV